MKDVVRFFASRPVFANLVTFMVLAFGTFAIFNMRREAFPKVDFGVVTVMTTWPGASPSEVERLLTVPLEQAIDEVDGIKKTESVSVENRSLIVLELEPDLSPSAKADTIDEIERVVSQERDLPADAEAPLVTEAKSDQFPIIQVSVSGPDPVKVREHAERLEDVIGEVDGVARIEKRGWREREILVEVKPETLRTWRLSLTDVSRAIEGRNVNLPGGKLKQGEDEWLVRAIGEFESAKDIEPVIIRANESGHWVRVKDVATVRDGFEDVTVVNRSNGERSIDLIVLKKSRADIIDMVDEVRKVVKDYEKEPGLEEGMKISFADDVSYYVRRRLGIVENNAWFGLALVIGTLFVFLGAGESLWTALGAPFALLATVLAMSVLGMSINVISMLGFIIVLGMLDDDAITVGDNIYRWREAGMDPLEAAVKGTVEVIGPVTASVLTAMAAFLPLALMSGIMGKFIWAIPVVVMLALAFSWLETMLILPAHLATLKQRKKKEKKARFEFVSDFYVGWVRIALRLRYAVLLGVLGMVGLAGFTASRMNFKLFSSEGIEQFMVRAEAKQGASLEETERLFLPVENVILALPASELDTFNTSIGIQQENPNDPYTKRGSHYAQAMVFLTPEARRDRTADQIIRGLKDEFAAIPGFEKVYFTRVNPGPPVGKAVSARFSAESFDRLHELEAMAREEASKIPGVIDLESDLEEGKKELHVVVDEKAASEAGLTAADIALQVRASFDGLVATKIRKLDEEVEVKVLFPEAARTKGRKAIEEVVIPNRNGYLVPLHTVARVEEKVGFSSIRHTEGKRTVTISGEVDEAITTSVRANLALQPRLESRIKEFAGSTVSFTGEDEDTKESMAGLFRAFAMAMGLIFLIIATTFGSVSQPALVMMSIPVGLSGVVFAFFFHGEPLGFMAMMGVVGIAGVVVNNSIVLVEFVNRCREDDGMDKRTSIVEAARVRLRPMLATSLTTLLGLMPTAYGIGGSDPFVKPMALAMAWGITFSLLMTLLTLPPMIAILDDVLAIPRWLYGLVTGRRDVPPHPAAGEGAPARH